MQRFSKIIQPQSLSWWLHLEKLSKHKRWAVFFRAICRAQSKGWKSMSFSINRWPQHNGFPNRVARRSARHLAKHKAFHMFFNGICRTQAKGSNSSSFLSIRWPHLTPAGSQHVWPNEEEKGKPNILVFVCFSERAVEHMYNTQTNTAQHGTDVWIYYDFIKLWLGCY